MNTSFDWNSEKNEVLRRERGITFENVVSAIERGDVVAVLDHPNQQRYPGQRIYYLRFNEYVLLVPFVTREDGTRFLKTIIPSRKATRDYLR